MPEVRGGSLEELRRVQGQGRQSRTPGCNSSGAAERSYPSPRPGAVARSSNPASKEQWLRRRRRA